MNQRAALDEASDLDLLRAVIDTQRLVNARSLSLEDVMTEIAVRTQALTASSGAVVELREGDEMVYRAVSGDAAAHLGVRVPVATSLSGRAVLTQEAQVCDDTECDSRVDHAMCRRMGIRSMVIVPLPAGNECVGVLKVLSREPGAFGERARELLELMAEFLADSIHHAREFERRAHEATHDGLTGLGNRALLLDRAAVALARRRRHGDDVAVLFLDLDGFKTINDTQGHAAGDIVLAAVATRLLANVRRTDTVARLGGDEYVVLCEGARPGDVDALARRLEAAVSEPVPFGSHLAVVGASIGVAWASDGDTADTLLARADAAMYAVKRASRNS